MLSARFTHRCEETNLLSYLSPLGVIVDLSMSQEGKVIQVILKNKESRMNAIVEECNSIIASDEFDPPCARSLLGRVAFCEAQCFNRFGAAAVKDIASKARDHFITRPLPKSLREKLKWLAKTLTEMRPRTIDCHIDTRPIILFTDGAAESSDPAVITYDLVSIGGVAIDTATGELRHFGDSVPTHIVEEWKSGGILQVITQAEVYPVLLAKDLFGKT